MKYLVCSVPQFLSESVGILLGMLLLTTCMTHTRPITVLALRRYKQASRSVRETSNFLCGISGKEPFDLSGCGLA